MKGVCDIQFNKFNRTLEKGEFNRKNEAPDGYLSRLDRETNEQIQAKLRHQIENPAKKGFDERSIRIAEIRPTEEDNELFDKRIVSQVKATITPKR